jgi:hypothetical protein
MKLKKEYLIESYKKYRLRRQLWAANSYNRSRGDQSTIDTVNKRQARVLWSQNTSAEQKDTVDRKEVLRSANRIARESGERIDPSNRENISGYYKQFAKRSDARWLTGTDLPKERKNSEIFLRQRMKKRGIK